MKKTTKVICALTSCIHNKVDGMKYVCSLSEIHLSLVSNDYGMELVCKMKETEKHDYST